MDNITVNIYCGAIVQIVLEKKSHQQEGDLNGILCSLYLMMMGNQENDTKYLNAVVQVKRYFEFYYLDGSNGQHFVFFAYIMCNRA